MNQKTFASQIAYLSAAYDREVSTEVAGVYWHQLGTLPDAPFIEAVTSHVNTSKFWPTVAELREATRTSMLNNAPKALPYPEVNTDAVLRDHARILGVDEDRYVSQILNRDRRSDRITKIHSDMPGGSAAKVNENRLVDEVLKT